MIPIGWNSILPQLSVFAATLKRRPAGSTPLNLFLSGLPGTNKTEGIVSLFEALGFEKVAQIDTGIVEQVGELAGIVDLGALRESKARLILGDLLDADILVLDEFLNAKAHVQPEFRRLLQGFLVMLAQVQKVNVKCFVAAANLQEDMRQGDANVLDSPTADRFAMVITAPSMFGGAMTERQQEAILEGEEDDSFVHDLLNAMDGINTFYDEVQRKLRKQITRYVMQLGGNLHPTDFAFEGRRGKLFRQFVVATLALCKAQPELDQDETVMAITGDCLTYHRLSGIELDMPKLESAHVEAYGVMMNAATVDSDISKEPDLIRKLALVVSNVDEVQPLTKVNVFQQVLEGEDTALKLACGELVHCPVFANEPTIVKDLFDGLDFGGQSFSLAPFLQAMASMSKTEMRALQITGGDTNEMETLLRQVSKYLRAWGLSLDSLQHERKMADQYAREALQCLKAMTASPNFGDGDQKRAAELIGALRRYLDPANASSHEDGSDQSAPVNLDGSGA